MKDTERLPAPSDDPALYIVNTGTVSSKGVHWCAVFFEKNVEEFFDPFGMPPTFYGFDNLLKTRSRLPTFKTYNSVSLQSMASIVCGHHCLFYAFHKCRGYAMEDIISFYPNKGQRKNDEVALNFVLQFSSIYYPRM